MSHQFDENLATLRDGLPRIWWGIYQGCLAVGFDSTQSFAILSTFILSQCPHGVRPNTTTGPVSDNPGE